MIPIFLIYFPLFQSIKSLHSFNHNGVNLCQVLYLPRKDTHLSNLKKNIHNVKFTLEQAKEDHKGEKTYNFTLSLTSAVNWGR